MTFEQYEKLFYRFEKLYILCKNTIGSCCIVLCILGLIIFFNDIFVMMPFFVLMFLFSIIIFLFEFIFYGILEEQIKLIKKLRGY